MQGKRVDKPFHAYQAGEYGKADDGHWLVCVPTGILGDLRLHEVTEHEDGTISVKPSILVTTRESGHDNVSYHGFLTHGIWSDC